ncbi:MAG: hypothetical protein ABSB88_00700 [Bryobacteraceae bacterium]|jgi:hypothetical protein
MTKPVDDLEAVRTVVEAVQGFKEDEQQRIFRWAAEKLGLKSPFGAVAQHAAPASAAPVAAPAASHPTPPGTLAVNGQDIRSFVTAKNPRSDIQYAATVAYYYQFEAPQAERKKCIDKDDLQEATRKTGRERFKRPDQTLRNAHTLGLLDKGDEAGTFCINTVGENLVAMTLPGDGGAPAKRGKKSPAKRAERGSVTKAATKKGPGKKA